METFKFWHSLHGYIILFVFFTAASTGSTCEAPSSPQCFRRKANETIYICEWSMKTNDSNIAYVLHFDYGNSTEKRFGKFRKTWCELSEESLIQYRSVNVWVEAHTSNSSCESTRTTVVLLHTIKYEAPQNVTISWSKNNLNLNWTEVEESPALAEIQFRKDGSREQWENREANTSTKYSITVENLLRQTAYQVQIRHRSVLAKNSLWSDWSSLIIIPAELEQPKTYIATSLINGTRQVNLTWESPPQAAAVTGVSYSVWDTQSSDGCPCKKRLRHTNLNKYTTYVSYSAVNIFVTATNAAGQSTPAVIPLPLVSTAGLKICDKTLLQEKVKRKTCLELYELQDGDSGPRKVFTLTARKHVNESMKDHIRYLYFEHRCQGGRPQTFEMCIFYHKEGVPLTEPQDFSFSGEKHNSVNLTWKMIPFENQRGFLTHYHLCTMKISSQDEPKECHNISASSTNHYLENLTPGSKYNISLAGLTRVGKGPYAIIIINTHPQIFGKVLPLGLYLLFVLLLISTMCTCVLTRVRKKLLPPVPRPIIPHFPHYQPQSQRLERREEVDDLSLQQLHPECRSALECAEETIAFRGEWDDDADGDVDNRWGNSNGERLSSADEALRSSKGEEMMELEQVGNEIDMLIYRNRLIFDVKTDSP